MAAPPPPPVVVSPVIALIIRVLTFICLLTSVIVMATTKASGYLGLVIVTVHFNDYYAYRYMVATAVVGMAYTLIQAAFTIFYITSGARFGGDGLTLVDFYGDKIISYVLATGAAATFGLTVDSNRGVDSSYYNQANGAASVLFVGFLLSAISSVFSSFSLSRRNLPPTQVGV